jgi:nucleoside-diphosphate-sugar epimerase
MLAELRELTGSALEAAYRDRRPGDLRDSLADVSRAREALGYEPAVDVREGLRRAYEYYASSPASTATYSRLR